MQVLYGTLNEAQGSKVQRGELERKRRGFETDVTSSRETLEVYCRRRVLSELHETMF